MKEMPPGSLVIEPKSPHQLQHLQITLPCFKLCPSVRCPVQSSAATKGAWIIKKVLRSSQRKAQQHWNKTRHTYGQCGSKKLDTLMVNVDPKEQENHWGGLGKFGRVRDIWSKQSALCCEIYIPPIKLKMLNAGRRTVQHRAKPWACPAVQDKAWWLKRNPFFSMLCSVPLQLLNWFSPWWSEANFFLPEIKRRQVYKKYILKKITQWCSILNLH